MNSSKRRGGKKQGNGDVEKNQLPKTYGRPPPPIPALDMVKVHWQYCEEAREVYITVRILGVEKALNYSFPLFVPKPRRAKAQKQAPAQRQAPALRRGPSEWHAAALRHAMVQRQAAAQRQAQARLGPGERILGEPNRSPGC